MAARRARGRCSSSSRSRVRCRAAFTLAGCGAPSPTAATPRPLTPRLQYGYSGYQGYPYPPQQRTAEQEAGLDESAPTFASQSVVVPDVPVAFELGIGDADAPEPAEAAPPLATVPLLDPVDFPSI